MFRSLVPRVASGRVAQSTLPPSRMLLAAKHARFESAKAGNPIPSDPTAQESSKPKKEEDPRKAMLRRHDDLQRDWDAKEITYEELKPRTEQPTPVCVHMSYQVVSSHIRCRMHI